MKNLSDEEFRDLFIRHKAGDKAALETFVKESQRYIAHVADKEMTRLYSGVFSLGLCSVISWEDLMQSGNVGLINALNKFDPSVGGGHQNITRKWFSTYAYNAIAWEIQRFIVSGLFISTSVNLYKSKFRIVRRLTAKSCSSRRVAAERKSDLTEILPKILGFLSKEDKEAIILYFGLDGKEPMTLEEVAGRLEKSYDRIRGTVVPRALKTLKKIYLRYEDGKIRP